MFSLTEAMKSIGFIGVGVMGGPMVRNLLKAGFEVTVFDASASAMEAVAKAGARPSNSPAALAQASECVITMVTKGSDVEQVLFGQEGVIDSIRPGTLYMDMSTVPPALTDAIGRKMLAKGVEMLDAPVGRTSQHAERGESLFMVGGSEAVLERARPVLQRLGDTIVHCGPLGSGIRMKVVNNFLASATNVATSQALALAEAAGIDPELARNVMLSTVAGQGHLGTTYPAKVLKGDFSPGFRIDLVIKDLGIAIDLADDRGCGLSMGRTALAAYRDADERGYSAHDWTVVYALARRSLLGKVPGSPS
jgi:4-hydroxybutyrate dehydrogenase/sulfolactaldehyde 3-reductase